MKRGADNALQSVIYRPGPELTWEVQAENGAVTVRTLALTFIPDPLIGELPAPGATATPEPAVATPGAPPSIAPPPSAGPVPPPLPSALPTPAPLPTATAPVGVLTPPPHVVPTIPPAPPSPVASGVLATAPPTPAPTATPGSTPALPGHARLLTLPAAELRFPAPLAGGAAHKFTIRLDRPEFDAFVSANPALRAVKVRINFLGADGTPILTRFGKPFELQTSLGVL